jgi:hypothetical protein
MFVIREKYAIEKTYVFFKVDFSPRGEKSLAKSEIRKKISEANFRLRKKVFGIRPALKAKQPKMSSEWTMREVGEKKTFGR